MTTSDERIMLARISKARKIADLIDRTFPELGDALADDPASVRAIAPWSRAPIERCAGLDTTRIHEDSRSHTSWATWHLVAQLLQARRQGPRYLPGSARLRDRQAAALTAAIARKGEEAYAS